MQINEIMLQFTIPVFTYETNKPHEENIGHIKAWDLFDKCGHGVVGACVVNGGLGREDARKVHELWRKRLSKLGWSEEKLNADLHFIWKYTNESDNLGNKLQDYIINNHIKGGLIPGIKPNLVRTTISITSNDDRDHWERYLIDEG